MGIPKTDQLLLNVYGGPGEESQKNRIVGSGGPPKKFLCVTK